MKGILFFVCKLPHTFDNLSIKFRLFHLFFSTTGGLDIYYLFLDYCNVERQGRLRVKCVERVLSRETLVEEQIQNNRMRSHCAETKTKSHLLISECIFFQFIVFHLCRVMQFWTKRVLAFATVASYLFLSGLENGDYG